MDGARSGSVEAADGVRLAYQVQGPPEAPVLLLLQGQANSHAWWDGLRDAFATTHRTVTFDYRGTGATRSEEGPSAAPWSTSSFADDAGAVLDALGAARAHVYGTSMGGRVAQLLAVRHPARVERLVLACTSPGGVLAQERSQEVRRSLAQPDPEARRQALLDLMYTPAFAASRGPASTLLGDPTMTAEATRRHLRVSVRHDASALLPEVGAPTLVLHGGDDRMTSPVNAEVLAAGIPEARLVVVPGGRHGFFEELEASVTPQVLDFLR